MGPRAYTGDNKLRIAVSASPFPSPGVTESFGFRNITPIMQLEVLTPADDPNLGDGFFLRIAFEESERNGLPSALWLADASPSTAMDFGILDLNLLLIPWDGVTDPPAAMRAAEVAFALVAELDEDNVEPDPNTTPTPEHLGLVEALQKGLTEKDWTSLGWWHRLSSWAQAEDADPEMIEPGFIDIPRIGPVRIRFDAIFFLPELTVSIDSKIWQVQDVYLIDAPGTDVVVQLECTAQSTEPERELTEAEVDALLEDPNALSDEDSPRLVLGWNCNTGVVEELSRQNTQVTVEEMMSRLVAELPGLPGRFLRRHALVAKVVERERGRLSEAIWAQPEPVERDFLTPIRAVQPRSGSEPLLRSAPKVGRNDPCPCGSGKKAKKCCGAG